MTGSPTTTMAAARFVQVIGRCYGKKLTEAEAGYILWNYTGYPMFWHTDNPRQELRMQAAAYLRGERFCDRCGTPVAQPQRVRVLLDREDQGVGWFNLCDTCHEEMSA